MKFNSLREVIEHFKCNGVHVKRNFRPKNFGTVIGNEIVYPDPRGGFWIEYFKKLD